MGHRVFVYLVMRIWKLSGFRVYYCMALPDGKFPSTGADAKPSPHDSYGIIRHQGWTPAILTHLSLLNERFLLFPFFKNLKII